MEPGKDDEAVLDEHRSRLRRVRDQPPAEPLPDNANDEVNLIDHGYTPGQVDAALDKMRAENQKRGI